VGLGASICTTCLPSTSPSVSKVGPDQRHKRHRHHGEQHAEYQDRHQRDQQGQNPPVHAITLDGARQGSFSYKLDRGSTFSCAMSTVDVVADLPFGFSPETTTRPRPTREEGSRGQFWGLRPAGRVRHRWRLRHG